MDSSVLEGVLEHPEEFLEVLTRSHRTILSFDMARHSTEPLQLFVLHLDGLLKSVVILDAHTLAEVVVCDAWISYLDWLRPVRMVVLFPTICPSLTLQPADFFVHLMPLLQQSRFDQQLLVLEDTVLHSFLESLFFYVAFVELNTNDWAVDRQDF